MTTSLLSKRTRFRAYQLGAEGSSFSYFDGATFTLIEARVTDLSQPQLEFEMRVCGVSTIGCLHITSWDSDHCTDGDLEIILKKWSPAKIEYPGYEPSTDCGKSCLARIIQYRQERAAAQVIKVDPPYVKSLSTSEKWGYRDVIYHPKYLSECANDNSTVKFFRTGAFTVASLGDVEHVAISSYLRRCGLFAEEVDVMILAHHGADNGFTTNSFLRTVSPTVAICTANYDNKFDHPRQEIRDLLYEHGIPIFTTKTGDVVLESVAPHLSKYRLTNLRANSSEISSAYDYTSKKSEKLKHNRDTVKELYARSKKRW